MIYGYALVHWEGAMIMIHHLDAQMSTKQSCIWGIAMQGRVGYSNELSLVFQHTFSYCGTHKFLTLTPSKSPRVRQDGRVRLGKSPDGMQTTTTHLVAHTAWPDIWPFTSPHQASEEPGVLYGVMQDQTGVAHGL
jgi:hypothetical protein